MKEVGHVSLVSRRLASPVGELKLFANESALVAINFPTRHKMCIRDRCWPWPRRCWLGRAISSSPLSLRMLPEAWWSRSQGRPW